MKSLQNPFPHRFSPGARGDLRRSPWGTLDQPWEVPDESWDDEEELRPPAEDDPLWREDFGADFDEDEPEPAPGDFWPDAADEEYARGQDIAAIARQVWSGPS